MCDSCVYCACDGCVGHVCVMVVCELLDTILTALCAQVDIIMIALNDHVDIFLKYIIFEALIDQVDIILIASQTLGPADGSNYVINYFGAGKWALVNFL